jgi:hypothetical protein
MTVGQMHLGRVAAVGDHLHRVAAGEDALEMGACVSHQDRAHAAFAHAPARGLHRIGGPQHQRVLVLDDEGDVAVGHGGLLFFHECDFCHTI